MAEWNNEIYLCVNLTPNLTWDSSNLIYAEQKDSMTIFCGDIIVNDPAARGHTPLVINPLSSLAVDAVDITDNDNFKTMLDSQVSVSISSFESGTG